MFLLVASFYVPNINEKQNEQMNKLISEQTKILGLHFLKALLGHGHSSKEKLTELGGLCEQGNTKETINK